MAYDPMTHDPMTPSPQICIGLLPSKGVQIPLRFAQLMHDPRDGRAVILLVHEPSGRALPLWLADDDALMILRALRGESTAVPDGAALAHSLVELLGGGIDHVSIDRIAGGVAQASITVVDARGELRLAARPSHAVALALRAAAPILTSEDLLEHVTARLAEAEARRQHKVAVAAESVVQTPAERWNQLLAHLSGHREI